MCQKGLAGQAFADGGAGKVVCTDCAVKNLQQRTLMNDKYDDDKYDDDNR